MFANPVPYTETINRLLAIAHDVDCIVDHFNLVWAVSTEVLDSKSWIGIGLFQCFTLSFFWQEFLSLFTNYCFVNTQLESIRLFQPFIQVVTGWNSCRFFFIKWLFSKHFWMLFSCFKGTLQLMNIFKFFDILFLFWYEHNAEAIKTNCNDTFSSRWRHS